MQDLKERAKSQLTIIEKIYEIKIKNKDEAAGLIASSVDNSRQVLFVCTSLNSWIASIRCEGEITIPLDLLKSLMDAK